MRLHADVSKANLNPVLLVQLIKSILIYGLTDTQLNKHSFLKVAYHCCGFRGPKSLIARSPLNPSFSSFYIGLSVFLFYLIQHETSSVFCFSQLVKVDFVFHKNKLNSTNLVNLQKEK